MNVVGKVGSLITQGVYSVATPFHPFGGAVDIIVVQQQDGSFRSTPWYVQFGKFQGVLKGAEKVVRINVNGVEANFHMYLDNSGEAYFIREADSGQDGEENRLPKDEREGALEHSLSVDNNQCNVDKDNIENYRLQSTMSDPGILRDEFSSFKSDRLDRNDSDACRFYDFQDDQSYEGSVDLSPEFGSSRFDNIDAVENFVEAQVSDAEMVLVSVDGHILTAPISSSEQDTENVQLGTPQFHLGPGESNGFCEGDSAFTVSEKAWDSEYLNDLNATASKPYSLNTHSHENLPQTESDLQKENEVHVHRKVIAFGSSHVLGKSEDQGEEKRGMHELEIGDEDGEYVNEDQEVEVKEEDSIKNQERDLSMHRDVEDTSPGTKKEDRFKSCLDLTIAAVDDEASESEDSSMEVQEEAKDIAEEFSQNVCLSNKTESEYAPEISHLDVEPVTDINVVSDAAERDHTVCKDEDLEAAKSSSERDVSVTESDRSELLGPQTPSSFEQTPLSSTFEISLCRNLLHCGMGLSAANEVFNAHRISAEEFRSAAKSIIKNENLVIRYKEKYLPWDKAASLVLGKAAFGLDLSIESEDAIHVEKELTPKQGRNDSGSASGRRWRLWPIPFRRVKTLQHSNSNSSEEVFVDSESVSQNLSIEQTPTSQCGTPRSEISTKSLHKKIVRTNIPTNEQISSLTLKEGQNDVTFSFSTRVLGLQQVQAHIYLWKWNARIVISDVDGTITKSDVLGQFMPLVGKDWSQSGVARLFSAIKENGYQLLFLSARAIVQAYLTKSFLFNLKQDGKTLPIGPVVISPDGLFPSLFREVIRRAPHEFKIACLEDIKALFPPDYNPFYAGFGNRDTDELTYRKIGIPKGKIFIINPKGEVAINHRIDVKSYTSLHTLVNDMFPPTSMVEQEDYNSWNYWKMPLADIDD